MILGTWAFLAGKRGNSCGFSLSFKGKEVFFVKTPKTEKTNLAYSTACDYREAYYV